MATFTAYTEEDLMSDVHESITRYIKGYLGVLRPKDADQRSQLVDEVMNTALDAILPSFEGEKWIYNPNHWIHQMIKEIGESFKVEESFN